VNKQKVVLVIASANPAAAKCLDAMSF